MLYRAFVYTGHPQAESENTVFFEVIGQAEPGAALRQLLAQAWQMPAAAVEHYNCFSESELRRHWGDVSERGADRDACLLQTGCSPSGAHYAQPDRTQLLVSPRWHGRLVAAQQHVARKQADGEMPYRTPRTAQTQQRTLQQVPA